MTPPGTPRETGDRMCYDVPSSRNPNVTYRCDLLANNGAGVCQCTDFRVRKQPNIDAGKEPLTDATTCRHLRAAARHFYRLLFADMAKSECQPQAR